MIANLVARVLAFGFATTCVGLFLWGPCGPGLPILLTPAMQITEFIDHGYESRAVLFFIQMACWAGVGALFGLLHHWTDTDVAHSR